MHEGVQLEFAHSGSGGAGDDAGGGSGWRSGLDVLSGGQRTLVSLALVIAVRWGLGMGAAGEAGWVRVPPQRSVVGLAEPLLCCRV